MRNSFLLSLSILGIALFAAAGLTQPAAENVLPAAAEERSGQVFAEAEMLDLLRLHNPGLKRLNGELSMAAAAAGKARLFRNPVISYEREQLYPDGGNAGEDVVALSVPVDLQGKRRLLRKAAGVQLTAEEQRIAWEMRFLEADFKALFYRLVWAERRREALKEQTTLYLSVLDSVRSRQGIGDYDRVRLEKASAEAESVYKEFVLEQHALKSELAQWLGSVVDHESFRAKGELLPAADLPGKEMLLAGVPEHPKVLAMLRRSQARELEARAARRRWLPEFQLTGGYKQERSSGETDGGFVVGVSLPLPFFDRGQADVKQASAAEAVSLHELEDVKNEITMHLDEAYEDLQGLRQMVREYERSALTYARQLKQMAGVAYLEGRMTVLELIDAYETYTEANLRLLALSLEARLAFISLERAVGELPAS